MHVKTGGTRTEANRHMTVEQTDRGNGRVNDIGALERSLVPAPRDMRRKRPPLLSFLLRLHTLRRVARVISLLTLDYMGVVGALFTALIVKTMIRGNLDPEAAWRQTRSWVAFAYLVTVLMFAASRRWTFAQPARAYRARRTAETAMVRATAGEGS